MQVTSYNSAITVDRAAVSPSRMREGDQVADDRQSQRDRSGTNERVEVALPSMQQTRQRVDAWQATQTAYDAPDGRAQRALQNYSDVEQAPRRAEISEMFGVDLYV